MCGSSEAQDCRVFYADAPRLALSADQTPQRCLLASTALIVSTGTPLSSTPPRHEGCAPDAALARAHDPTAPPKRHRSSLRALSGRRAVPRRTPGTQQSACTRSHANAALLHTPHAVRAAAERAAVSGAPLPVSAPPCPHSCAPLSTHHGRPADRTHTHTHTHPRAHTHMPLRPANATARLARVSPAPLRNAPIPLPTSRPLAGGAAPHARKRARSRTPPLAASASTSRGDLTPTVSAARAVFGDLQVISVISSAPDGSSRVGELTRQARPTRACSAGGG